MLFLALVACKAPPEAPSGLDDSTTFVLRNFYADDATFQAGMQGFLDWYETDGVALLGEEANLDTVGAFTVGDLTAEDIAHLPVVDEILVDPDDGTREPRDLSRAKGVISLAEMDCDWKTAEALLVRPDQDVVFNGDWDGYQREYVTSRQAFEDATANGDYTRIPDPLDPFVDSFDGADTESTLLLTYNTVDPSPVLTSNLENYEMHLDLRHGEFDLGDGETVSGFAIITYAIDAAWGGGGTNALLQSFSVEVNVERPNNKTLRMLSVWSEPKGTGVDPESNLTLNFAVNKATASSERLSDICSGEIEI